MRQFVAFSCILSLLLPLLVFSGLASQPVLAMSQNIFNSTVPSGQISPGEEIKIGARYPVLRGTADKTFEFEVELSYTGGKEARIFDLSAKGPPGFFVSIRHGFDFREIGAIRLDPTKFYPETIKVVLIPVFRLLPERLPEPGEYVVTLFASSGEIKGSFDLKAIITAKYGLRAKTGGVLEGRLNTNVTAGEDNPIPIIIHNTGTAPLKKVTFSTEKPGGWSITFNPEEIDTIAPGAKREVEMKIKPPRKTIAGDYMVTLRIDEEGGVAYDRLDIRVTVLTPTLWGWVGVGIVVAIIAGLAVIFMRLGRR